MHRWHKENNMDECLDKRRVFVNSSKKMVLSRETEYSSVDDDSLASDSETKSSPLNSLLLSIIDERRRDYSLSEENDEFLMVQDHNALWAKMFSKHFIDSPDDTHKDDMLFYVRKLPAENSDELQPQTSVEVYRKWSTCKPLLTDPEIDFEETVYLNFILQHFEYYVTCAVCTRTVDGRSKLLRKLTQRVYASPSHRKMDSKGTEEEITYPNLFFTIDNFEEAFANQVVQENEMICVELVALNCQGTFCGVLFRGSVNYDALKEVFDAKESLGHRLTMSWWFKEQNRVEFVKMAGPNGKGFAEMAVSCAKEPEPTVHSSQFHNHSRRSSDPNSGWRHIFHGSLKRGVLKKSRSNTESLGHEEMSTSCSEEQKHYSIDESDEIADECRNGEPTKPMSRSWHWWKGRKSAKSTVSLNSYLTYVSLPWHRIISDLCGENGNALAFFFTEDDRDHRNDV